VARAAGGGGHAFFSHGIRTTAPRRAVSAKGARAGHHPNAGRGVHKGSPRTSLHYPLLVTFGFPVRPLLAQDPVHDRQQPARGRDLRGIRTLALPQPLVLAAELGVRPHRRTNRFDHSPVQPLVALLREAPVKILPPDAWTEGTSPA
jgi:hypothetical protein